MSSKTERETEQSEHTEREDLRTTAEFLGIEPNGSRMIRLTGLRRAELTAILLGSPQESRRRAHLGTLGSFSRISSEALQAMGGLDTMGKNGVAWLELSKTETSRGMMSPIEALSDDQLVLEALDQARNAQLSLGLHSPNKP